MAPRVKSGTPKKNIINVEGKNIELSNLHKLMYPKAGFTKGQVIDYYARLGATILPYLKDRPVTLKRYPDGVKGEHFYEKDAPSFTPKWVKTFPVPRVGGGPMINYILINDLPTLIWSANTANLEIHPFLHTVRGLDRPTSVVFDLDPGDGADILKSCEVAFLVKELLERMNLTCLAKVSGSKGIHLHVPLNTSSTYEVTQPFAQTIAQSLEADHPDLVVSDMGKAKRRGKVFVDWSQNAWHKTTVAVYSLRAKQERPYVAMPVSWDELENAVASRDASSLFFDPEGALHRLKQLGDRFAPLLKLKQNLPKPFLQLASTTSRTTSGLPTRALEPYRNKRDFTKTPEPPPSMPKPSRQGSRRLYVIQKHAASHLHYDLRFEMSGTLKSWAVPKGPPLEANEKRLAMATEDHPLEYARFEGIIPEGEYGGGTVMVWDIGTYEIIDGNYWKGRLHIFLSGAKLKGEWILTRKTDQHGKRNVWEWINAGGRMKKLSSVKKDSSALTARSVEEIAAAKDAVWHSNRTDHGKPATPDLRTTIIDVSALPRARKGFIPPMMAEPVASLPDDATLWMYEVKFDGYRCLAFNEKNRVNLFSRRGNRLNDDFPAIAQALEKLPEGTMIDGEIVALDEHGRPSFNALQNRRSGNQSLHYYVFDLLGHEGRSLLGVELRARRELLQSILPASSAVIFSEHFQTTAGQLLKSARELGLEGIVAKRADSFYEPGKRSRAWVKYKIQQGQEFVIGGYKIGNPLESLLIGYYHKGKLIFLDKVRNGLTPWLRKELGQKLAPLETEICPFANLPERKTRLGAVTKEEMKNCRWVKPEIVAQIEFAEWTPDNHLRHPKFVGLREDKDPQEVVRE
jgi:bifunctional non-homologous end joining protein LigD